MKEISISLLIIIILGNCKKESNEKVCYDCADQSGNNIGSTCGDDKEDARKNMIGNYNGVNYTYGTYPETEFNSKCRLR